jgi:hypothetical protein
MQGRLEIRISGYVDVPIDRTNSGDRFELLQHRTSAHVAGVQQAVDAGERLEQLRPYESVCVGDQSNPHGSR